MPLSLLSIFLLGTRARGTTLKINTEHEFFQFITPDKDYGIREATYMRVHRRTITIYHRDDVLQLVTLSVDTRLDFCYAIAWDMETQKMYFLIDLGRLQRLIR